MVLFEMNLERLVVDVVLWLAPTITAVADVTPLVLFSAVDVEFIIPVETSHTETALGMSLEATLVRRTRVIVAKLLVFAQLSIGEQLMLMCKNFFVPCAEIAARY